MVEIHDVRFHATDSTGVEATVIAVYVEVEVS